MRTVLLLPLLLTGCFDGIIEASCNDCEGGFVSISEEGCEDLAAYMECETWQYVSVTDDDCNVGADPTTHNQCVIERCQNEDFVCEVPTEE